MFKTNIRHCFTSIDILGHVHPLNMVCLGLIWHPFLSPPPVNLAWECGASSGCWLVFPPPQRLQSQHHLQISILISSSRLHESNLLCFSLRASVFFPFDGLLSQPIEMVMTIRLNPCVIFFFYLAERLASTFAEVFSQAIG